MGKPRSLLLFIFCLIKQKFHSKNCRLQRKLNSDRRSRRRGMMTLWQQPRPKFVFSFISPFILGEIRVLDLRRWNLYTLPVKYLGLSKNTPSSSSLRTTWSAIRPTRSPSRSAGSCSKISWRQTWSRWTSSSLISWAKASRTRRTRPRFRWLPAIVIAHLSQSVLG